MGEERRWECAGDEHRRIYGSINGLLGQRLVRVDFHRRTMRLGGLPGAQRSHPVVSFNTALPKPGRRSLLAVYSLRRGFEINKKTKLNILL